MNRLFGTPKETTQQQLQRQNEIVLNRNNGGVGGGGGDGDPRILQIQKLETDIAQLQSHVNALNTKALDARKRAKACVTITPPTKNTITTQDKRMAEMYLKEEENHIKAIDRAIIMMTSYREQLNALNELESYNNFQRNMKQTNGEIKKFMMKSGQDSCDMVDIALDDKESKQDIYKMSTIFNQTFGTLLSEDNGGASNDRLNDLLQEVDSERMQIKENSIIMNNSSPLQYQKEVVYNPNNSFYQQQYPPLQQQYNPYQQQQDYNHLQYSSLSSQQQQQQRPQQQVQYSFSSMGTVQGLNKQTSSSSSPQQKRAVNLLDDVGL